MITWLIFWTLRSRGHGPLGDSYSVSGIHGRSDKKCPIRVIKMEFGIVPDGSDQNWFQIVRGCHVQILNKKSGLKIFKKTFESHNLGWEVGWSFWCWFKGWSRYQSDPFDSKNNHGSQLHNQTDDVITWPTNDVTNNQ